MVAETVDRRSNHKTPALGAHTNLISSSEPAQTYTAGIITRHGLHMTTLYFPLHLQAGCLMDSMYYHVTN
jgi:hypothetical protein